MNAMKIIRGIMLLESGIQVTNIITIEISISSILTIIVIICFFMEEKEISPMANDKV